MKRFALLALALFAANVSAFPLEKRTDQVTDPSTAMQACPPNTPPVGTITPAVPANASSSGTQAPAPTPPASNDFHVQNGLDAQKLNTKFASLTPSSPCNVDDTACINGGFAQCVGGSFVITQCAAGTTCVALPLVNKPGTSITCDTTADALARFAASGVTGGLTGGPPAATYVTSAPSTAETQPSNTPPVGTIAPAVPANASSSGTQAPAPTPPASNDFHAQNGLDAQKLNAKFASLTPSSPCNVGDIACINGGFAQCVGGSFVITQCAAGTTCVALPLVNKPGTSITCDTTADALARFAASGVTGGLTG